eukprot:Platyproteum_vivax@DN12234_c0_g1_i1.p1
MSMAFRTMLRLDLLGAAIPRQFAALQRMNCASAFSTLRYTKTHEFLRFHDNNQVTLGITSYAREHLGEVIFVDFPNVGDQVKSGKSILNIESVKAVGEVYSPVDGTVIELNPKIEEEVNIVNEDPEGEGWLVKLECEATDPEQFLDKEAYEQICNKES